MYTSPHSHNNTERENKNKQQIAQQHQQQKQVWKKGVLASWEITENKSATSSLQFSVKTLGETCFNAKLGKKEE